MVKDPVCGMNVDEKTTLHKTIHANSVYHFCSATCQNEFIKNPDKYLKTNGSTQHASHYGGYCPTGSCSMPAKGLAWYFYLGLLILLLLVVFLFAL